MSRVDILLSTYNGERHLRALLDSLLAQSYTQWRLVVRDDGSSDTTLELLEQYRSPLSLCLEQGENIGVKASFLKLLARSEGDYLAFCDQDDVWLPQKLERAVTFLERLPPERPALLCMAQTLVAEDLTPLRPSLPPRRPLSFANALLENPTPGCAMVFNRAARDLIVSAPPDPVQIGMHDWWLYAVTAAFGEVYYLPEAALLYRQHSHNTVGVAQGGLETWRRRLRRYRTGGGLPLVVTQAQELARRYGDRLPEGPGGQLRRFLDQRAGFRARLAYAHYGEAYRQAPADNAIFKFLMVFNRL